MDRNEFLKKLRKQAKESGVKFECVHDRGKGSHMLVFFGENFTTVPKGELKKGTLSSIKKDLKLS